MQGYVAEVRWCSNVQAPVISVSTLADKLPFKSYFSSESGQPSLGFSQDVQSMLNLNCNGSNECLEALVNDAYPYVKDGTFSRSLNPKTRKLEYGPFSADERKFIADVIGIVEN